jgi:hypothetical protein
VVDPAPTLVDASSAQAEVGSASVDVRATQPVLVPVESSSVAVEVDVGGDEVERRLVDESGATPR